MEPLPAPPLPALVGPVMRIDKKQLHCLQYTTVRPNTSATHIHLVEKGFCLQAQGPQMRHASWVGATAVLCGSEFESTSPTLHAGIYSAFPPSGQGILSPSDNLPPQLQWEASGMPHPGLLWEAMPFCK